LLNCVALAEVCGVKRAAFFLLGEARTAGGGYLWSMVYSLCAIIFLKMKKRPIEGFGSV